jgi:hypothetical protein
MRLETAKRVETTSKSRETVPFWVLQPTLGMRFPASSPQKFVTWVCWRTKCTSFNEGIKSMSKRLSASIRVCSMYQNCSTNLSALWKPGTRVPYQNLAVWLDWQRSRRRAPAIASEVRSSLHDAAEPHTQLLALSVGVTKRRT